MGSAENIIKKIREFEQWEPVSDSGKEAKNSALLHYRRSLDGLKSRSSESGTVKALRIARDTLKMIQFDLYGDDAPKIGRIRDAIKLIDNEIGVENG